LTNRPAVDVWRSRSHRVGSRRPRSSSARRNKRSRVRAPSILLRAHEVTQIQS
jgi:hypothetical protein